MVHRFFFSSRRRHTRCGRDWSSDVCSSDLKISAMNSIEKHETFKRGLYSGSAGYFKPNGDFDFNVIIRSTLYNEKLKNSSCPVGGAITLKSSPEMEYEEWTTKGKARKVVPNSDE